MKHWEIIFTDYWQTFIHVQTPFDIIPTLYKLAKLDLWVTILENDIEICFEVVIQVVKGSRKQA